MFAIVCVSRLFILGMIDFYKEFELKKAVLIGLLFSIGISQQKWNAEFMREYGGVTYGPNSDKP